MTRLTGVACALLEVLALPAGPAPAMAAREAFPGAQGYGRFAAGGRGGRILPVTTLADAGPGSLRACIDAYGPRVCIFRVGGVIRYTTTRPVIVNPYITIAGQTAPGGGILLTHAGGANGFTPLVIKNTHDVIIRDIRVRPDRRGTQREANSGIVIENSRRVILDHVSTSWSLDENVGGYAQNDEITISNSIFAEGVPKHDKCALLASDPKGPQRISFVHNLCAHNGDRNPDVNVTPGSCVEVVNNVLYNAEFEFTEIWASYGGTPVSVVGNYYKAGPDTKAGFAHALVQQSTGSSGRARLYDRGNFFDGVLPENAGVAGIRVAAPPCRITVPVTGAQAAYHHVLAHSGAFPRDAVDRRIVREVATGTGHIVRTFGSLPPIAPGQPYVDSDGDGMSDAWEVAHGTDPRAPDAWGDADHDGWTNLDAFLDFLQRRLLARSS